MTDGQHQVPTRRMQPDLPEAGIDVGAGAGAGARVVDRPEAGAAPRAADPAARPAHQPAREGASIINDIGVTGRTPIRTCVGCRGRDAQDHLVRIAVVANRPEVDLRRRLPGRGAYVHCNPACVERATRKGRLGRALRIALHPSHTSALRQLVIGSVGANRPALDSRSHCSSLPMQSPSSSTEDGNGTATPGTDREMNWLTRPQRRFVDGTRQAKGQ